MSTTNNNIISDMAGSGDSTNVKPLPDTKIPINVASRNGLLPLCQAKQFTPRVIPKKKPDNDIRSAGKPRKFKTPLRRSLTMSDMSPITHNCKIPARYIAYQDEYKYNAETILKYHQKKILTKCFEALKLNYWRQLRKDLKDLEETIEKRNEQLAEIKDRRRSESSELFNIKAKLYKCEDLYSEIENELKSCKEEKDTALIDLDKYKMFFENYQKELLENQTQLKKARKECEKYCELWKIENKKVTELELAKQHICNEMTNMDVCMKENKIQINVFITIINELKRKLAEAIADNQTLENVNAETMQSLSETQDDLKEMESNYNKSVEASILLQRELNDMEHTVEGMKETNLFLERKNHELQMKLRQLELVSLRIKNKSWVKKLLDAGRIPIHVLLELATIMLPAFPSVNMRNDEDTLEDLILLSAKNN